MSKTTAAGAPLDLDKLRTEFEQIVRGDTNLVRSPSGDYLAIATAFKWHGFVLARQAAPSPQSASVDAIGQDERALFEAWVKTRIGYPFAGTFLNFMWDAWQARAALAHRSVSPAPSVAASVSDAKIREIGALTYGFPIKSDDLEFAKEVLKEAAAASQAAPATCQPSGAIGQALAGEPKICPENFGHLCDFSLREDGRCAHCGRDEDLAMSANYRQGHLLSYWRAGFHGKDIDATVRGNALAAYDDGIKSHALLATPADPSRAAIDTKGGA